MAHIEDEIKDLKRRIEELKASKPAHDTTGLHDMELLRLEEKLDERIDTLRDDKRGDEASRSSCHGDER